VFATISGDGVGLLHFCTKSIDGEYYRKMIRDVIPLSKEFLGLNGITHFVQDYAPAHRAHATTACLRDEPHLEDMDHPPQSPDLNPIENVWAIMKKRLSPSPTMSLDDLKVTLKQIWYGLDDEYIRKCMRSMPERLDAGFAAKGCHTKY
jgi:hypothetical protein